MDSARSVLQKRQAGIYDDVYHLSQSLQESLIWFKNEKQALIKQKKLFEDPFFPAENKSIFSTQKPPKNFVWKRPTEVIKAPQFISDGVSRFDVLQGQLGDCWLLAAVSSLSLHPNLFAQVVPDGDNQNFTRDYAGVFLFRLWQFGTWVDVVVDDRLPTYANELAFMHSKDKVEFWSALLEKAYAKLVGSYEALKGGSTCEAMEDFTGGITEMFEMGQKTPADLWDIMLRAQGRQSLMGCSIDTDQPGQIEGKGPMGLILGHAYSVTDVRILHRGKQEVRMVRSRNPWGNDAEWSGPWSDKSKEWDEISAGERQQIGLSITDDGEFWMCYEDFTKYFTKLEICHLSPESDAKLQNKAKRQWLANREEGEWKRGSTAGGCRNFIATFHMNPQFRVQVVDPDENDDEDMGTLIIGLMQKGMRQKRVSEGIDIFTIGYAIYKLPNPKDTNPLDQRFFKTNASVTKSPQFINLREICGRHKLRPGNYVIVPSTFNPNEEAQFIIRIFSETSCTTKELDQETRISSTIDIVDSNVAANEEQTVKLRAAFSAIAGEDGEVDAWELQDILNAAFKQELQFKGFSLETCRSMVALKDIDLSGKLGFDEFKILWSELRLYKTIFKKFDHDNSGTLDSFELREAMNSVGCQISNKIYTAVATRFATKDGQIYFDDFVLLLVRIMTVFDTYKAQEKMKDGRALFSQDEFIRSIIYV